MRQLAVWNVGDGRRGGIQSVRHVSSPTTGHAGIIHCFPQRWAHHASVGCSDVDFAASAVLPTPPHHPLAMPFNFLEISCSNFDQCQQRVGLVKSSTGQKLGMPIFKKHRV
jgi:hypothetical protein